EAALRARHTSCFLRLIEHAEQADLDPSRWQLLHLIDDDIHNLRAALTWAMQHGSQSALLISAALMCWLRTYGPRAEAKQLLAEVLALPGATAHTIPRVKLLFEAGILLLFSFEYDQAQAHGEESLALSRELGYRQGEADALLALGRIAHTGRYDQAAAQHYLDMALAIYRELNDLRGISYTTILLGEVAMYRADLSQARALAEESLAIAQQAGFWNPWPLSTLASIVKLEGDLDRARSLMEQLLPNLKTIGITAGCLTELGGIATRQGDFAAAHAFLDTALGLWKALGTEALVKLQCLPMAILFQAEGDYERAVQCYRQSLAATYHLRADWKTWLLGLGGLASTLGQHELAAALLGTTCTVDEAIHPFWPIERADYNRLVAATRASLGAAAFDAAWAEGRAAPFEAAVEAAVSTLEAVLRVTGQSTSA
ncbi:MAG: tetratricopeptide repeat protein, partial [Anaerolineae bacterium]